MTDVFVALRQRMPSLSKSELRIAEFVLEHPSIVVESTITRLAELAQTSPASVARFCRNVGFGGYKEFRIAIAAANSREEAARELFRVDDAEIDAGDSALDLVTKVAYQEARAIEETARGLDLDALDAVVAAVREAPRIDVFGAGASGLTAQDLQLKLHRIGIPCFCWADAHLALTSFALTDVKSVAIGISHTGQTLETNQMLRLARERGATTVAITNFPDSPLASVADRLLVTSVRESRYRTGAMSSRLAQMAIIDFLVVRLLQGRIDSVGELLRRTYDAVQAHRLDGD
ncbi:MurR/RpiR family transcriptional regulator [Microbacterium sp. NIBRBAC000506063]|uniref:MurR/RpiR family transcriptional regulator n=1 Tax=Microbacterium sp. NIBRBAC000506063 TaxID=2734618 RepID=UPI001BB76C59|nr:MurR/RpiR family transcriptional regulator [Microbacterium sp. NIBRBAC000506063]QTV80004.1 MurR/RpiR family transcriptional regulator [Microbacterium sp. NIBRBAC000506063]